MSYKIRIKEEAIDDLDQIYSYIKLDKPQTAKKIVNHIHKCILSLDEFPRRGTRCHLFETKPDTEIRYILCDGFLVFYEISHDHVLITHVATPGQDWHRFLF